MKKHFLLGVFGLAAIMVGYGQSAEASAILNFSTGSASALCDTRVAVSATNCFSAGGFGFTVVPNGGGPTNDATIFYVGPVGTWNIDTLAVTTSNAPGTAQVGKINLALADVRHLSGTDDLTVDFGHDNFSLPAGTNPLSSTGAASYDVAQADATFQDSSFLTGYARTQNDMAIAAPTSATALDLVTNTPGCFPFAGTSQSCAMNSPSVSFTNVGPLYSLSARTIIHQHTSATDQAGYLEKAAVNPVPEPATLVLFGSGLIALAGIARRRRKQQ